MLVSWGKTRRNDENYNILGGNRHPDTSVYFLPHYTFLIPPQVFITYSADWAPKDSLNWPLSSPLPGASKRQRKWNLARSICENWQQMVRKQKCSWKTPLSVIQVRKPSFLSFRNNWLILYFNEINLSCQSAWRFFNRCVALYIGQLPTSEADLFSGKSPLCWRGTETQFWQVIVK